MSEKCKDCIYQGYIAEAGMTWCNKDCDTEAEDCEQFRSYTSAQTITSITVDPANMVSAGYMNEDGSLTKLGQDLLNEVINIKSPYVFDPGNISSVITTTGVDDTVTEIRRDVIDKESLLNYIKMRQHEDIVNAMNTDDVSKSSYHKGKAEAYDQLYIDLMEGKL